MGLEFSRHVGVEGTARLLEGLEGVGIHDFGPHVAVIAAGIAVARENMGEMGRGVAHADGAGHADVLQNLGLALHGVRWRRAGMEVKVDEG